LGQRRKWALIILTMLVALLIIGVFVTTIGPASISIKNAFRIIASRVPRLGAKVVKDWPKSHEVIVLKVRLPRVLVGIVVGAGLSIAGVSFQGLFKNPMADPYVIGISAGASFGATLAIVLKIGSPFPGIGGVPLCAFVGALVTSFAVYNIARVGRKVPVDTLLLSGIAVGSLLSALVSLLMILNSKDLYQILYWGMGSLALANYHDLLLSIPYIVLGMAITLIYSRDLNVLMLGEEAAISLGVNVEKLKRILLIAGSLTVAAAVSVSGIIGFVGLIVPHIARLIVGPDHRILLPTATLGGAMFLVISDTVARTVAPPTEIPVGVVTAIFGAPFFLYLLRKRKQQIM
jgi:iron complex transport system permease protein